MAIITESVDVGHASPDGGDFRQEPGLLLKSFEMALLDQIVRHMVGRSSRFLRPFEATDDVQLVSQQQLCGEADDPCEPDVDQPCEIVAGLLPQRSPADASFSQVSVGVGGLWDFTSLDAVIGQIRLHDAGHRRRRRRWQEFD